MGSKCTTCQELKEQIINSEIQSHNNTQYSTNNSLVLQTITNPERVRLPPINLQSYGCYEGEWLKGKRDGTGKFTFKDNSVYEGQFLQDKAHGLGKLKFQNGDIYEGDWKNNSADGFGVYMMFNGTKYEGEWQNDQQNGEGIEYWSDGTVFQGNFKNGQKYGKGSFVNLGKIQFQNGNWFEGNFENNKIEGNGIFCWLNKKQYDGQWKNNRINGKGTTKWTDNRIYIGDYKSKLTNVDDKKDGYGSFTWANGKKYTGYWKNNKQHGQDSQMEIKSLEFGKTDNQQNGMMKIHEFFITNLFILCWSLQMTYFQNSKAFLQSANSFSKLLLSSNYFFKTAIVSSQSKNLSVNYYLNYVNSLQICSLWYSLAFNQAQEIQRCSLSFYNSSYQVWLQSKFREQFQDFIYKIKQAFYLIKNNKKQNK